MLKRLIYSTILFSWLFINEVHASELSLISEKYILYNTVDNEVLLEKDSDERTNIASLTKIMSTIVAIENINDYDNKVTITKKMIQDIESDVAVAGFKVGDSVTYDDLLYGTMLVSGADAINALAYSISGSEKDFVKLMNEKVSELKLNNTHFTNVTGLYNSNHFSSAYDMAQILSYALKNEKFKTIFEAYDYKTTNDLTFKSTRNSYTTFGVDMTNVTGSKTGFISKAGYCLASTGKTEDASFLLITLNAYDKSNGNPAINDTVHIYDYYEKNYSYQNIINTSDSIYELNTMYSKNNKYKIISDKTITKYIENNFEKSRLTYEYDGSKEVTPFMIKGFKLGTLKIYLDNKLIYEFSVKYDGSLKIDILPLLHEYKYYVIGLILMIILLITIKVKKIKKRKRFNMYNN